MWVNNLPIGIQFLFIYLVSFTLVLLCLHFNSVVLFSKHWKCFKININIDVFIFPIYTFVSLCLNKKNLLFKAEKVKVNMGVPAAQILFLLLVELSELLRKQGNNAGLSVKVQPATSDQFEKGWPILLPTFMVMEITAK